MSPTKIYIASCVLLLIVALAGGSPADCTQRAFVTGQTTYLGARPCGEFQCPEDKRVDYTYFCHPGVDTECVDDPMAVLQRWTYYTCANEETGECTADDSTVTYGGGKKTVGC